jgi:hypothetical protein
MKLGKNIIKYEDTDADREMEQLLRRMQQARHTFDVTMSRKIMELGEEILQEKHNLHVAEEEIAEDMVHGLKHMAEAADDIVFPDKTEE